MKNKYYILIIIALILLVLFLGICFDKTDRIVIEGINGTYVFDIKDGKTIEIIYGPITYNFDNGKIENLRGLVNEKDGDLKFTKLPPKYVMMELSNEEERDIALLINAVKKSDSSKNLKINSTDPCLVQGVICGKVYNSIYMMNFENLNINNEYVNKDLLRLTNKLMDIAIEKFGNGNELHGYVSFSKIFNAW